MNGRKIILLGALVWLGLNGLSFAQQSKTAPSVETFVRLALRNNPDLRARALAVQAAAKEIPQAGSLPDPVLSVSFMNLPVNAFVFNKEPMSGKQLSLRQKIPFPGKLGLKKSVARARFQIAEQTRIELENQLVGRVKSTYFALFAVDRMLRVTAKNMALLKQFNRIAETRYAVGKGVQQDILKAQVEYSNLRNRQIALRQQRQSLQAKLNILVNRPVDIPIPKIRTIRLDSLSQTLGELESLAFALRPILKKSRLVVQKAERVFRLAKKDFWPDVTLGVAYTQRDRLKTGAPGIDYVSATVAFNLPVFFGQKQAQRTEEADLNLQKAKAELENMRNLLRFQLRDAWVRAEKNRKQLKLLREGILPQAKQALDAALTSYQVGKIDFLTLLNNQQTLFRYESDYYRAQAEYEIALTELEIIVGKPLFLRAKER